MITALDDVMPDTPILSGYPLGTKSQRNHVIISNKKQRVYATYHLP